MPVSITSPTRWGQSYANRSFDYTDLGQLSDEEVYSLSGSGQKTVVYQQHYDYDGLHNRTVSTGHTDYLGTGQTKFEYVYLNNRLRRVDVKNAATGAVLGDIRYLYDLAGNMVERRELGASSGEVMGRDAFHQLTRYGGGQYEYDHAGRRVIKRDGVQTTYSFWDGETLLSEIVYEGSAVAWRSYAHGPTGRLVEWRDDVAGSPEFWYHLTDHHGSSSGVLDETALSETAIFIPPFRGCDPARTGSGPGEG